MNVRKALLASLFCMLMGSSQSQEWSTLRKKTIPVFLDSIQIDTLSIAPNSFKIRNINQSDFRIYYNSGYLVWLKKPASKEVEVEYRVFPLFLEKEYQRRSFDSVFYKFGIPSQRLLTPSTSRRPLDFGKLNSNGSLGRSLSFGNRQDAVLNSNLNLQLNGYIGDSILLSAAISDNNIPIQPDGNTQNLNEFDQVYIQFSKDKWKLSVGDLDIRQDQLYFIQFYKRLQGLSFSTENKLSGSVVNNLLASGAVAKGKFTRNIFQGIEGNQGPYRLKGANQELFFIVLAGTERVFIDGELLQRGEDQDYIINYNTAEVTFMPKQMITKDKRIQIEFEYADRNYLNSQLYLNDKIRIGDRFSLTVGYFGNTDAKNSPINQELNNEKKQFLSGIGDRVSSAFYPSASLDTSTQGSILYRKVDTLFGNNQRATVYVFDNRIGIEKYSLSFTDLGEGGGSYVLDPNAAANGKVYKWVPPDDQTGEKKGRFEPVLLLVAPRKQQVMSLSASWKPSEHSSLLVDLASSQFDVNRFSSLDKANDDGYAARILFNNKHTIPNSKKLSLNTSLQAEYASPTFRPVERLRSVEFTRDWGFDLTTDPAQEKIVNASVELNEDNKHAAQYSVGFYNRDTRFSGLRNQVQHIFFKNGWNIRNVLSLTRFEDLIGRGEFFRPNVDISKKLPSWHNREFALKYFMERTVKKDKNTEQVTPNSFSFSTLQLSTQSDPSKENKWGLKYFTREDELPDGLKLTRSDRSHNFNVNGEWMSNEHHQLRVNATYRKLDVVDNRFGQKKDESILGRMEYFADVWKGAIQGSTIYELGSGQEPRRDFTFFEVPAGQGEYAWIDYNNDGIQQISEFEIARFRDQAKFIRIFTPTSEFIRSDYILFNYNVTVNPSAALDNENKGLVNQFLRRIYLQSSLQVNEKSIASGQRNFNPFDIAPTDTNLIVFDQLQNHSVSFNKFSQLWGIDFNYLQNSNRAFLSYGFETRRNRDLSIRIRSNWFKRLSVDFISRFNRTILETPSLSNRNFNIISKSFEPRISYTQATQLRLQAGVKVDRKQNRDGVEAKLNSIYTEGKYNLVSSISVAGKFTYSAIAFNGIPSSSLGYTMLEGLLPGKNYIWTLDLTKRLSSFVELSVQYEGRKAGTSGTAHLGRAQVRAIL